MPEPAAGVGFDPVVFDLDGTVVDTVELIVKSFRYATSTVLGEVLPDEFIIAGVGRPLRAQMERLSVEHAQELYDVYREYNHRRHDELIRGYDGIEEVLDAHKAAGRRTGIVTSKSRDTTEMAFRAVGLEARFDVVGRGCVAVTPLRYDLLDHELLVELATWELDLERLRA